MANVKISELPSATALTLASIYPVVQGGVTKQITASLFLTALSPEMFGATGGSDDTTAFQDAINAAASAGGGTVVCKPGRTYTLSTLTPKENVVLSCYGATLKMKDNVEEPMFYEVTTKSTYFRNFHIQGGSFNLNKANNHTTNHSGGFVWLTNWQECSFRNLTITNAFKDIFLPAGCEDFVYENITADSCGQNSGGFYCYGLSVATDGTNPCRRLSVRNFKISNHFGYGIHWDHAEDCSAQNIVFDTFTRASLAIGVTWTQAQRISMSNVRCTSIDGDSMECNASEDITLDNVRIASPGNRGIIFGDNGTGISNDRVSIRNLKTTATGGSFSLSVNFLKNASFEHCSFDKTFTATFATTRESIRFNDCKWSAVLPAVALESTNIYFNNGVFTDWTLANVNPNKIEAILPAVSVANAGVLDVDMTNFVRSFTPGTGNGGWLEWTTSFTTNYAQGSRQRLEFYHYDTTLNISAVTNPADGSVARQFTAAADGANRRIRLTNGTGNACYAAVRVDIVSA